jgi:hypothetical protein
MRTKKVGALLVALAASLSVTGPAAAASPPSVPVYPPPIRPISWLAAGDSYSSGQEAPAVRTVADRG